MRNKGLWRIILVLLVASVGKPVAFSQKIRINTNEIESLIDEWNFANNTRNIHSFERVYADELTFYTQNITRRRAIELKQQLFKLKPDFRQRIITEITYKPYSKGVVKADFTKEVFDRNQWKRFPSYLLVSYEKNHYTIVGESDYLTDRKLKFKPDIGEPMAFEKAPVVPDTPRKDPVTTSVQADSVQVLPDESLANVSQFADSTGTSDDEIKAEALKDEFKVEDLKLVFSDISALGTITIPKGYVYLLIGLLGLGGLMIFIADSVGKGRRTKRTGHLSKQHAEAEHVVRNFKIQSGFESFVTTLFDPMLFKIKRLKTEHVYAGQGAPAEKGPDFVLEYENKETHLRFAIKCQYYQNVAKNEVQLFNNERQRLFRQFEDDRDMDVYYVLGFGGMPDDPKELFLIPAKDVSGEFITKASLRDYSKSGMFYYSRATGRIQ